MPQILDRCVKEVSKDSDVDSPWGVCISTLSEAGRIKYDKEKGKWVESSNDDSRDDELIASAKKVTKKASANKTFNSFMRELKDVISSPRNQNRDIQFKSLRDKYKGSLSNWRKNLAAPHKGLMMYIEDMDQWDTPETLSAALHTLASLYADTIEEGATGRLKARRVASRYLESSLLK